MARVQKQMIGPMSSLTAGTNSTIKIPSTNKYHALALRMNVATVAAITHGGANKWGDYIESIQLRTDGDVEIDVTPALCKVLSDTYVWGDASNVLMIPLAWPNMRLSGGEDVSGFGTADVGTMDIVVKLKSGAHVIDLFELDALVASYNEPLGQHLRIRRHPRVISGAGPFELDDIFQIGEVIYAIALDSNNFSKSTLKVGSRIVEESTQETALAFGELIGRGNDGSVIDFLGRDRLDEAHLVTPEPHRLKIEWNAAATVDYAVVSLSPIGG